VLADHAAAVADKEERRSPGTALAFDFDPHGNPGVLPDDAQGGDRHRRPFPVALAPERFPFLDDVGVDTNRGVVDEDAIVAPADIDAAVAAALPFAIDPSKITVEQGVSYLPSPIKLHDYAVGVMAAFGSVVEHLGRVRGLSGQTMTLNRRLCGFHLNEIPRVGLAA